MSYFDFDSFETTNSRLKNALQLGKQVANTQAQILITGAAGSGKSSLAQYIAKRSRSNQIYAFDCKNQKLADLDNVTGGTLILEDLDAADAALQAELFQRLDLLSARRVRIISTSRRDLRSLARGGHFRHDLFYRLSVIHLDLPSLIDYKDELTAVIHFIVEVTKIMYGMPQLIVTAAAMERMKDWAWPNNFRELENVIERAAAISHDGVIESANIQFDGATSEARDEAVLAGMTLSEVERKLILQTLQLTAQNRTRAAQILGISIRTLRNKLNEYRLEEVAV